MTRGRSASRITAFVFNWFNLHTRSILVCSSAWTANLRGNLSSFDLPSMGRQERTEYYRDDRDYAGLLGDEDYEEEEVEEENGAEPVPEGEEENYTQECQEYYERRERLRELERQRLRRSRDNGRSTSTSTSKPLPYDNYGNFFGPSEPVVTRRIIADVRAREIASKVAARQAQEVSEPHKVSKGSSGAVSERRSLEMPKQAKVVNEQVVKLQRLKEARDYSFLFTDEDPAASPPRDEARASTKERQNDCRHSKPTTPLAKGNPGVQPRGANLAKPIASIPSKTSVGSKQAPVRHPTPTAKLPKPPERSPISKSKVSSQSGSTSNLSKTTSGPGRPSQPQQARPNVSIPGLSNGKKPLSSSVNAQLKSLVASGPKVAGKQSLPSTAAKPAPGKGAPVKSAPPGSLERKVPQIPASKSQASTSRPDQKRPGVVTMGRAGSTGHYDQRRPVQSAASAKMTMKPPSKLQKRPRDSDSEDSFLDDDDDGGDYRSLIHKMLRYNPSKYHDIDDEDDRMMEASFHTIQAEEKRSAKIAREEDERELALIEEEERREREMARKKRKQQR